MVDQIEKWKKEEQRELQTEAYHIAQRIKNAFGTINLFFGVRARSFNLKSSGCKKKKNATSSTTYQSSECVSIITDNHYFMKYFWEKMAVAQMSNRKIKAN